jgi:serine/threonine protein kinase
MLMEHYPEGDLWKRVLNAGNVFTEHDIVRTMSDVLSAIAYMHKKGHSINDIKPSNLLVQPLPENQFQIVVCDLGGCSELSTDDKQIPLEYVTQGFVPQHEDFATKYVDLHCLAETMRCLFQRGKVWNLFCQMSCSFSPPDRMSL